MVLTVAAVLQVGVIEQHLIDGAEESAAVQAAQSQQLRWLPPVDDPLAERKLGS